MAADGTTFPPFPPFQTIPELDPAVSLNFTDQVWINQAGLDVRCNIGDLAALAPAGVTSFNNRRGAILLNAGDIVLAEGALLNSPAFQGVPQAPTAATGTASDQIATTQFVANAIGAATPGVTSFNNRTGAVSLTGPDIVAAGGVLRNSPAFTGQPIAPTPPPGSNNNTLATTGFVTAAVAAMSPGVTSFNNRTGPIQLTLADVTGVGGAPLVTPIFTGVPQAPNPPRGSDTTQIATCEFVMDAIANSVAGVQSFNGRVGAVTLTTADITAAGGGTVSSVGLAMPTMFTVTGSPVTGSGTLTVTANAQAASTVLAAPVGAGGPPSFRSLTAADIPLLGYLPLSGGAITGNLSVGGSLTAPTPAPGDNSNNVATTQFVDAALAALPPSGGTVTSVAMTVPNIFTITGSPITTSGTLAIGNRAQNANTVFAGPVSGGAMGGVFRALVAADIPSLSGTYLPLVGGTLSGPGNLTVAGVIQTQNQLQITGAAGTNRIIDFMTAGVPRWVIAAGVDAESGSNAGSNLYVQSYTDAGAPLVAALVINRASGQAVFGANVTAPSFSASTFTSGYYLNDWQTCLDGSDNYSIYKSGLGAVVQISANNGTLNTQAIAANGSVTAAGNVISGGVFYDNGAVGSYRGLQIQTAGSARWWLYAAGEPETGGNAGSNFYISRYSDAGAFIDTPFGINRANGQISFGSTVNVNGAVSATGDVVSGGTVYGQQFVINVAPPNSGGNSFYWDNGLQWHDEVSGGWRTINGPNGTAFQINAAGATQINGVNAFLTINGTTTAAINLQGATGNDRYVQWSDATGHARWYMRCDSVAESGANAGSNFDLLRYDDTGAYLGTVLSFSRANGNASFSGYIQSNGGLIVANQTANTNRAFQIQTSGVPRWGIVGDNEAETGANAGTNLVFYAYTDAGAQNGSPPLTISRATGTVTMNGGLNVASGGIGVQNANIQINSTGWPSLILNKATSGNGAQVIGDTNGLYRWSVILGNATAESGGNVGSNFVISNYADNGTYLGDVLTIYRSNSQVVVGSFLTAGNTIQSANGFGCRQGQPGPYGPNVFNLNWTGAATQLWIDSTNEGTINVTASDRRLKSNIKAAGDALAAVARIPIHNLDFKRGDAPKQHWPFSFIADEIAETLPFAAIKDTEEDGDHWVSFSPQHMIATLWKAVQELSAKVEALEGA